MVGEKKEENFRKSNPIYTAVGCQNNSNLQQRSEQSDVEQKDVRQYKNGLFPCLPSPIVAVSCCP